LEEQQDPKVSKIKNQILFLHIEANLLYNFRRFLHASASGSLKRGANFGATRTFGNSAGYESAVVMNFRG